VLRGFDRGLCINELLQVCSQACDIDVFLGNKEIDAIVDVLACSIPVSKLRHVDRRLCESIERTGDRRGEHKQAGSTFEGKSNFRLLDFQQQVIL
jgi:hypothetical protein